jgi:hypothetical protein
LHLFEQAEDRAGVAEFSSGTGRINTSADATGALGMERNCSVSDMIKLLLMHYVVISTNGRNLAVG